MSSFLTFMFTYRFIRAVAYRWTTRWLCGYIGWENRQPLPACVYHSVRKKNNTQQHRGYANVQDGKEHWTLVNVLHWSMKKKFVIKKCSRFSFICMGHVILYILQKNMNKDHEKADMDNKLWVTLFATFLLVTMRWPLAFAGASRSGLTTAWLTVAISLLWSLFWFYRITMVI